MNVLDSLQLWIKDTALYNDFLLHMPAPLNNIYFDTIVLALALVYLVYRVMDGMQMSKRHRRVKERQLELQEKAAENEIHIINHEREARNNREEMNQFMRFMEMSVLANTTNQMSGIGQRPITFDQFKEQEKREQISENTEKVHETFDTIDAEPISDPVPDANVVADVVSENERITSENEKIAAELEAMRMEKIQMQLEFAEREKAREADMARVKADMELKEKEKQNEIDKLQSALSAEKEKAEKQIDTMAKNLNVYKANKEKEIENLTARLSETNLTPDEKQAEIDRLSAEMDRMKEEKERELVEMENEYKQMVAAKEQEISSLTNEMAEMKDKHGSAMTQISDAFEKAQSAQKDAEDQNIAEIKRLTAQLDQIKHEKEDEIASLQNNYDQIVANLKSSLDQEKKKVKELDEAALEQGEEIAKMQSIIAGMEDKNSDLYQTTSENLDHLREEQAAINSEKEAAQKNVEEINAQISDQSAATEREIAKKQKQIDRIASEQEAEDNVKKMRAEMVQTPQHVVKPFYGNSSKADISGTLFQQLVQEHERDSNLSKELEAQRRLQEETARANREQLEQHLIKDAQEEKSREKHVEDEARLRAIEEQKQKAYEQAKREEETGGKEKKKHGFFRK